MDLHAILHNDDNDYDEDEDHSSGEHLIEPNPYMMTTAATTPLSTTTSSSSSSSSLADGGMSDPEQQQHQHQKHQRRRSSSRNHRHHHHSSTGNNNVEMDLERILRESDDDDDEDDDDLELDHVENHHHHGRHRHSRNYYLSTDTQDDDDDDKFTLASTIVTTEHHLLGHSPSKPITLLTNVLSSSPSSSHHHGYLAPSSHAATPTLSSSTSNGIPRNAQEWAVLQAILGEEEDDDDEDDDEDDPLDADEWVVEARDHTKRKERPPPQVQPTPSIVDAILVSSSDDDDDDDDHLERLLLQDSEDDHHVKTPVPPFQRSAAIPDQWQFTSPSSPFVASSSSQQDSKMLHDHQSLSHHDSPMIIKRPQIDSITSKDHSSTLSTLQHASLSNTNKQTGIKQHEHHHHHHKDVQDNEEARWLARSEAAMSQAQSYERKLLRPAPRDTIVSPLQVKRRLKPKLQVQSKMQQLQQQQLEQQQQQQLHRSLLSPSSSHHHHQHLNTNNNSTNNNNHMTKKFGFSGVVELQRRPKISAVLSRNLDGQPHASQNHSSSSFSTRGVGLPTALAVNSKFIAIGTQGGVILVFDLFEVLRQELGRPTGNNNTTSMDPTTTAPQVNPTAQSTASNLYSSTTNAMMASTTTTMTSAVSSLDLAKNGEVIIAGYTNGMLVLWDCIRGVALRTVSDLHPSPITSVRFVAAANATTGGAAATMSSSAAAADTFKVVSVDAGGLVYKIQFSKNILYGYSMDTDCLLDGTAGQILAMNVLAPYPGGGGGTTHSNNNHHLTPRMSQRKSHPMEKIVLIGLSSDRSSFCVAVEPAIHVLHRWAKPTIDRILPPGHANITNVNPASFLPCLSWEWALVSGGGHVLTPILARAWGCCLQLLRAIFSTLDDNDDSPTRKPLQQQQQLQWPAFGVHDEFEASAPVVAMEWLNERSLVYLTVTNEFTVVDTVMMTLLERLDFSELSLVYAEFSLSRSASSSLSSSNPKVYSTTFQNSIRASDDRLMVLCQNEVKNISIVGSKQRILALEQDGEWLEALALALDHYENTVKSQEDRKRDPQQRLLKHPEFISTRNDDEEWIAKLLLRYLNLAVENAPDSAPVNEVAQRPYDGWVDLAQSHFQMLAGVCVEFCVVTRRLDLLFGAIFRRFQSAGYTSVFLDVMEPYVLSDKLDYIAPEVMAHFVEHCKATNGVATVERCLLHMDVTIMDFDSIISLLRKNGMYSALFYVFNQGLNDYITPLEMVLERLFDVADRKDAAIGVDQRRKDGLAQNDFENLGYKAIIYLRHCFSGKSFPQETELQPEDRLLSLRPELLRFLLHESYAPSSSLKSSKDADAALSPSRLTRHPYMHILFAVDPRAMLDTLSLALDAPDSVFEPPKTAFESIQGWEVEVGADLTDSLMGSPRSNSVDSEAQLLCPDRQRIISVLLSLIIPESPNASNPSPAYQSTAARNSFLDFLAKYLMKGVVRTDKNVTFMILSRMAARYATETEPSLRVQSQSQILQLLSALPQNAYEADEVLALVQSAGIHRASLLLHQEGASSWHEGINDFKRRSHHFMCAINCYLEDDDPAFRNEVFEYIKKECSGSSESSTSEDGLPSENLCDTVILKLPDLVGLDANLTAELVADLFIDRFDEVISFLNANDGEALYFFLHAIISGEMNQVDSVACSVLNANLSMEHHHQYLSLMAKLYPDLVYGYLSTHDNYRAEECLKLCQEHDIADASAYLLERMGNVSSALQLLLQTLESKMMSLKRTIRNIGVDPYKNRTPKRYTLGGKVQRSQPSFHPKQEKELESLKRMLIVALDLCERNSGTWSMRSEQGSQLWFNVLDRLINAKGFLRLSKEQAEHADVLAGILSDLLRLTMQRMVSSVPLPDLVYKVTSDHSNSRLGELRELIDGLLGTYRFELGVFEGALNAIKYDVRCLQQKNSSLRRSGYCVRKVKRAPIEKTGLSSLADPWMASFTTLVATAKGDATLVETGRQHAGQSASENGLGFALEQLRTRRFIQKIDETSLHSELKQGGRLNMMTEPDRKYQIGESSEAAFFGERLVGSLGEAEHRGSLMMSYM